MFTFLLGRWSIMLWRSETESRMSGLHLCETGQMFRYLLDEAEKYLLQAGIHSLLWYIGKGTKNGWPRCCINVSSLPLHQHQHHLWCLSVAGVLFGFHSWLFVQSPDLQGQGGPTTQLFCWTWLIVKLFTNFTSSLVLLVFVPTEQGKWPPGHVALSFLFV